MRNIHKIDPKTLAQWLEEDSVMLIDVREPAEYRSESIAKSKNLPLSKVTIDAAHLPEHHNKKLVFHCQAGRRSMLACEKLQRDGANVDVWNLEGGINAWKASGLPTVFSAKKCIPLDQQVRLTIGIIILIGMACGYWVAEAWYLLPVVAGLGLVNSGLTGWCGMAKILAKMPWNK